MNNVHNINEHMALTCDECGSAKFALLRSDGIECHGCGKRHPFVWRELEASRCPDCDGGGRREQTGYVDGSGCPHTCRVCCDTCQGIGWVGPEAEQRLALEQA